MDCSLLPEGSVSKTVQLLSHVINLRSFYPQIMSSALTSAKTHFSAGFEAECRCPNWFECISKSLSNQDGFYKRS